jgi:hypothetical protein
LARARAFWVSRLKAHSILTAVIIVMRSSAPPTAEESLLGPIQMGVAISIPHSRDDGASWLRVVVQFEMAGDTLSVTVGDGSTMPGFSLEPSITATDHICVAIFEYVKSVFEDPVWFATAVGRGKIGF